ncbi:hypothetical protein HDU76_004182 [Blyttiomyces sp. JEL0837]|nr:hypothetical protein HDU76_004182 [Blyttiomyces sp. JEL0837]
MRETLAVDMDETLAKTHEMIIKFHNQNYNTNNSPQDFKTYSYCKEWGCSAEVCAARVKEFMSSEEWYGSIEPISGAFEALQTLKEHYELVVVTSRPSCVADMTHRFVESHFPNLFSGVVFAGGLAHQFPSKPKAEHVQKIHPSFQIIQQSFNSSVTLTTQDSDTSILSPLAATSFTPSHQSNQPTASIQLPKRKSDLCRALGATILIDDSLDHARDCIVAGIDVLLFDYEGQYPWSKGSITSTNESKVETQQEPGNLTRVNNWEQISEHLVGRARKRFDELKMLHLSAKGSMQHQQESEHQDQSVLQQEGPGITRDYTSYKSGKWRQNDDGVLMVGC